MVPPLSLLQPAEVHTAAQLHAFVTNLLQQHNAAQRDVRHAAPLKKSFIAAFFTKAAANKPDIRAEKPRLDTFLESLWHVAQDYRERPFEFHFIAEMLERAFHAPPMPYDWAAVLAQPYQPVRENIYQEKTPEFYQYADTYNYFERVVKRQIEQLKRIFQQPALPEYDAPMILDGHKVHWFSLSVTAYLEAALTPFEWDPQGYEDGLGEAGWGWLVGFMHDGQYTE